MIYLVYAVLDEALKLFGAAQLILQEYKLRLVVMECLSTSLPAYKERC